MSTAANELLPEPVRADVRDLLLVLADSKRVLGMRYAGWILGAPELEAGIAFASMAQDEWGHARQLYALLRDFGEEADRLEHGREAEEYVSTEALAREPADWPAAVAVNALVDVALTVQFEALADCCYPPLRQRVEKLLDEERFHSAHGAAWVRRLAGGGEAASVAMRTAAACTLPAVLRWFGPDSERAARLREHGVADAAGSELRARYLRRVGALLETLGLVGTPPAPDFDDFDEARRQPPGATPDAATVARIRGDRNRVFLMD